MSAGENITVPAGAILSWGALVATTAQFLYPGSYENGTSTAGENLARVILPRAGVLRNLYCTAGAATIWTVRINGVSSALTATAAAPGNANDTTHRVTVAAGDIITILLGGAAGADARCSVEFV